MATLLNKAIKIACTSLLLQSQLCVGEVIMYDKQPPSAEEMGNILFSTPARDNGQNELPGKVKSRSISFGHKAAYQPEKNPIPMEEASVNSIGLPIQFSYNSAKIMSKSTPFLDQIGKMMNLENYRNENLLIEGQTDASGSDKYNKALSEKRAQAVKSYLVDNFQVSPEKLFISGRGEENPLPDTAPNASVNRRVQFYKAP